MNQPPRKNTRSPRGAGRSRRPKQAVAERRPAQGRRPAPASGEFAPPETRTPALPPVASFSELDIPAPLLKTLAHRGMEAPFPIQAATLPNSLTGRDVLGRGRTGSGKTLAFGLALLARTAGQRAEPRRPLGLVLAPTRELAHQIAEALAPYAKSLKLRTATVVGGLSINRQADALRGGAELVIATPGRLKDLVDRGDCELRSVTITVLDEADQMCDMGFLPQVTGLLDQVDPEGQRMLFSATLDRNVDRLVRRYLDDPTVHSVDPSAGAVTTMDHHLLHVRDEEKRTVATEIAARDGRVILFVDTKRSADRFAKHLLKSGVRAAALHGGRSQPQRNRTLAQFKNSEVTALVATNVAARGIDIADLDLVVNIDPPTDHKDYLHRAGRTARAGASGNVVTLLLPEQRREMTRLMSTAGITPQTARVAPGEDALARITGARTPSGVPVSAPAAPAPAAPSAASASASASKSRNSRGRRGRSSRRPHRQPRQGAGR